MKAEPRKESGFQVSEILSVRIRRTCSPLLIRQRDGSGPASAWWACAGSPAELCRPTASASSGPSRPPHPQSWCWYSDLQKTQALKVLKVLLHTLLGWIMTLSLLELRKYTRQIKPWPKYPINLGDKRLKMSKQGTITIKSSTLPADCPSKWQQSHSPLRRCSPSTISMRWALLGGCSGSSRSPWFNFTHLGTNTFGSSSALKKATRWRTRNFSTDPTPEGSSTVEHQWGKVRSGAPVKKKLHSGCRDRQSLPQPTAWRVSAGRSVKCTHAAFNEARKNPSAVFSNCEFNGQSFYD